MEQYILDRMKFFAQNIDELSIGQVVIDIDNSKCVITNKTLNSVEVYITKKTEQGIDCTNWFSMDTFNKRFKI